MTRLRIDLWLCLLLAAVVGCDSPMPGSGRSDHEADGLELPSGEAAVTGEIAGEAFETLDAYFRVTPMAGRERVDLVFSDTVLDDCGLPLPREGRRVFVRFTGVTELPEGETRIERANADDEGEPSATSIHYEHSLDGHWVGVGEGVARIEVREVGRSRVEGRAALCFDDGAGSCVRGAFSARVCLSRLDGYLPREGTGTADPPGAAEAER